MDETVAARVGWNLLDSGALYRLVALGGILRNLAVGGVLRVDAAQAGLLPGALMRNAGLAFVCRPVALTVENSQLWRLEEARYLLSGELKKEQQASVQATLTERYTDEAIQFIHEHRDGPFFVYLPHTMPHIPQYVSPKFEGKSKGGLYGGKAGEVDHLLGDASKAREQVGWEPKTKFEDLVNLMVDADVALLDPDALGERPPVRCAQTHAQPVSVRSLR